FSTYSTDVEPTGPLPPPFPWELPQRVYVRDLATGVNELVSRALNHPLQPPNEDSRRPSLSDDGRFVAFESHAWNLVAELVRPGHVYVLDRTTGTTTVAGVQDPDLHYCNATPFASSCHYGNNHMPSISGDGRFVVFSSGSMRLVPANVESVGTRVYLFDRLGGRLRRLSVTADRWEPEGCSENPTISADGKVVAYDAWDPTIVENDENLDDDVFSTEWTCEDSGRCRTLAQCPAEPLDCVPATSSVLRLRKHPPGGINEDTLFWRWAGEPAAEAFPDPAGDGLYQLCLYATSLALDVAAPEAPACAGADRPCWRSISKGYKLFDPRGGLTSLTLTSSPGARRILARGDGPLLDAPFLPLHGAQGIVVQLHETDTGRCWGADFAASSISRNVAGLPVIGSRRDGRFSARIP
ncbi:MAG: hypothetical protein AB1689_08525, partial [Thermodesulfobacteriota bacterium]